MDLRAVDLLARLRLAADVRVVAASAELWALIDLCGLLDALGPGIGCSGSKLVPAQQTANGLPAWGQYKPSDEGGYEPWALQVVEVIGGKIAELTFFLDTKTLFPLFGLPERLA